MTTSPRPRRAALAVALAATTLLGTPVAAQAAPVAAARQAQLVAAPSDVVVPDPLPQPGDKGSLTLKSQYNGTDGVTAIEGVCYAIAPVLGVDLTTDQGWRDAALYQDPATVPAHQVGETQAFTATTADGTTTLTDLPVGLYQIEANGYPTFYMTVPYANPDGTLDWTYVVSPKHETWVSVGDIPQAGPTGVCPPMAVHGTDPTPTPATTPSPSTSNPTFVPQIPSGGADNDGSANGGANNGGAGNGGGNNGGGANNGGAGNGGALDRPVFSAGGLAYTGAEVLSVLGLGFSALLTGFGLIILARRRREQEQRLQRVSVRD